MTTKKLTLTGIDNADQIMAIYNEDSTGNFCSYGEIGILYSPTAAGNRPRYPEIKAIEDIVSIVSNSRADIAVHMCGKAISEVVYDGSGFGHAICEELNRVSGRVQLNLNYGALTNTRKDKLKRFLCASADLYSHVRFIVQDHDGNKELISSITKNYAEYNNVDILFDGSGGTGKSPEYWSAPYDNIYCGYAGGLNPDNLVHNIKLISEVCHDRETWLDMESGIRTGDMLDIGKCIECIKIMGQEWP